MSIFAILRVALKALNRNKMRSLLTMLGVIIGVAAVITMVALGTGAQFAIEQQIASAGTNLIVIRAGSYARGGVHGGVGSATTLTVKDIDAIREQVPGAQYISASVNTREQVIAGNQNWPSRIEGCDVELPLIQFWPTQHGTFFHDDACQERSQSRRARLDREREPVWRERRPGWPNHPDSEAVVQGHRRHGAKGIWGVWRRSR